MIVVRLQGGLGNQLFQYAAGRALSLHHGVELALDKSWFNNIPAKNTPRFYALNFYKINARDLTVDEKKSASIYSHRILSRIRFLESNWKLIRENGSDFNENFRHAPNNSFLIGYWQSPSYFKDFSDIIKSELTLKDVCKKDHMLIIDAMKSTNSISIHIRRGDYVKNPIAANFHGTCSIEYYLSALEVLAKIAPKPVIYIFSDDINWVKSNIKFPYPVIYLEQNIQNPIRDLHLMAECKHHIIANSTFSWWGAWLGNNSAKNVVAPKYWFKGGSKQPRTLFPEGWIVLPN
jgi:hypothetical protein